MLVAVSPMKTEKSIPQCLRCGTCCQNGGPALHREDLKLIENGTLSIHDLFTIRKGEPVWDNVRNQRIFSDAEMIKIKGSENVWACKFYCRKDNSCQIYLQRPVECRALNCRDTRKIRQLYEKERLSRGDLLEGKKELLSLVKDHDLKCGYDRIRALTQSSDPGSMSARFSQLIEIALYDGNLRELLIEKGVLHREAMAFFFGFPLMETMERFGYKIEKMEGERYRIFPV